MQPRVFIPDFGMGNLHSIKQGLKRIGVSPVVSADSSEIKKADKIILPGVGHFQTAMQHLGELGMIDALNDFVLLKKKPVLGICLGMQLMTHNSEEGADARGFGWIDANVIRFRITDVVKYKVPHIGWNPVGIMQSNSLFREIPDLSEFYFIHAYHLKLNNPDDVLGETNYETFFPSAIARDNIFGVQFHPEKSFKAGNMVLKNFIDY